MVVAVGKLAHGQNTIREDADNIVKALQNKHGTALERVMFFPCEKETANSHVRLAKVISGTLGRNVDWTTVAYSLSRESGDAATRKDGIQHPSETVQFCPEQWELVKQGRVKLPVGWNLTKAEEIFPPKS